LSHGPLVAKLFWRSANATDSLGKGCPKVIARRKAIDHANTIAVKAMMICRVSWSVMAITPAGRSSRCPERSAGSLLSISLRQAL
jgi:hypothetical protein